MFRAEILGYVDDRLHLSSILKKKLMTPKGDWIRPYWVDDPKFNLENHVHQISLPAPGSMQHLFDFVSRKMATGLDMKKPLWQVYVIEGLNAVDGLGEGSFGILTIVHHSLFDGVARAACFRS